MDKEKKRELLLRDLLPFHEPIVRPIICGAGKISKDNDRKIEEKMEKGLIEKMALVKGRGKKTKMVLRPGVCPRESFRTSILCLLLGYPMLKISGVDRHYVEFVKTFKPDTVIKVRIEMWNAMEDYSSQDVARLKHFFESLAK